MTHHLENLFIAFCAFMIGVTVAAHVENTTGKQERIAAVQPLSDAEFDRRWKGL